MKQLPDSEEVLSRIPQAKERRALRDALRITARDPNLLITINSTYFVQGGEAKHKMGVNCTERAAITTTRIVDGKPLLTENDPDADRAQLKLLETDDFDSEARESDYRLQELVGSARGQ